MPVDIKQFSCPKCASPLDLKNAGRSKSVVCPSCGSQIDLTSPEYQIIGSVGDRPDPQETQFKVGMQGALGSTMHEIIGRVVYHDDEDNIWDEWLLLSAAGEYVWISDSANEGMALWHSFVPTNPVEPDSIEEGATLNLRNAPVRVRDTGEARIDYLEGELTWKARVGDSVKYAEADGPNQRISIEYTESEIEFYWGERLDRAATAKAFGVVELPPPEKAVASGGGCAKAFSGIGIFGIVGLCILGMCSFIAFTSGAGSSFSVAATPQPICATPSAATVTAFSARNPGAVPTPICYIPTSVPRSSGGFFSPGRSSSSSSSPSMKSGSTGSRSIGGSSHSSSSSSSGGK
jgi:hypothetical protein